MLGYSAKLSEKPIDKHLLNILLQKDTSSSRHPGKYLQCKYALHYYYREQLWKSKSNKSSAIELPIAVLRYQI
ncbi:hypothetical protein SAY86_018948 [Trapa natans]|uniref:Uncharacterized protein n=1 Tax=Trapa natans TaxID=22666 RepID=A0AAN7R1F8_TRANT|nr:hypothetical protein SAY86_018948 [Trapa natans]